MRMGCAWPLQAAFLLWTGYAWPLQAAYSSWTGCAWPLQASYSFWTGSAWPLQAACSFWIGYAWPLQASLLQGRFKAQYVGAEQILALGFKRQTAQHPSFCGVFRYFVRVKGWDWTVVLFQMAVSILPLHCRRSRQELWDCGLHFAG